MDKKEKQPREKKGMPLAPVFLLGATVLLLIEMYFIVNLPRVYLVQIILGAAILACTYVFIAALLKEIHKSGEHASRRKGVVSDAEENLGAAGGG